MANGNEPDILGSQLGVGQDNLGPGMSDLGMSQPSEANSVGQDNPALAQLMGSDFFKSLTQLDDPASRALALQDARKRLEGQEPAQAKDKLASMILPALLAGGAALGGQGGLAAGIGLGGLQAPQLLAQEENKARAEQYEDLIEREQKALQRLDGVSQRVTQMAIANPEGFLNPETGEPVVNPYLQGWVQFGAGGMPLDLSTKYQAAQRANDPHFGTRQDMFMSMLENAQTDQARTQAAGLIAWNMEMPPEMRDVLVPLLVQTMNDPTKGEETLAEMGKRATPGSLRLAYAALLEEGYSSPAQAPGLFAKNLQFLPAGVKTYDDKLFHDATKTIMNWEMDPANQNTLATIYEQFGQGTDDAARAIAEEALSDNSVLLQAYVDNMQQLADDGYEEAMFHESALNIIMNTDAIKAMVNQAAEAGLEFDLDEYITNKISQIPSSMDQLFNVRQKDTGLMLSETYTYIDKQLQAAHGTGLQGAKGRNMASIAFRAARKDVRQEHGMTVNQSPPLEEVQERAYQYVISMLKQTGVIQ